MADPTPTVRLGGRTSVTVEEFKRLRAALDRGLTRQQLRAWARENLGRGISNDAIRDLRSQRRQQQRNRQRFGRGPRRSTLRDVPRVETTGRKGWEVVGVATIRTVGGVTLERQINYRTGQNPTRDAIMRRLEAIARRIGMGDLDSGGQVIAVRLASITRYV